MFCINFLTCFLQEPHEYKWKKRKWHRVSETRFNVKVNDQSGDSISEVAQPSHHLLYCLSAYPRRQTLRRSPLHGISEKTENWLRGKHPPFHVRETLISLPVFSFLKYCGLKRNNIMVCFSRKNITLLFHLSKMSEREHGYLWLSSEYRPTHPRASAPSKQPDISDESTFRVCSRRRRANSEAWIVWQ